ncbi:MAG: hypothetical protein H3C48_19930 [Chitinophagaceae bacterium]|nr:hypothetical protein [Chitinophagaceae bacterium]
MNFLTQKIKLTESIFFSGFTDYHNHILPGVDDGMATMEEAFAALAFFEQLGVSTIVFTPHEMNDIKLAAGRREEVYEQLLAGYTGGMQLVLAGEYMLDSGFEERMREGLRVLKDDWVLVETSFWAPPNHLYDLLFQITLAGFTPVIAHPERYAYMGRPVYHRLKEKDCLLQLNLLSLAGQYGGRVQKNAEYLLDQGMYDLVGTDIHRLHSFKESLSGMRITSKRYNALRALFQ